MKIPKEDLVERIIKSILKKRGIIHTQETLSKLVQEELNKINDKYTITPSRARRIALGIDNIEVTVKTRRSDEGKKPEKCPACESELKMLYAKNLVEEKIVVGFKCTNCEYSGDIEAYVPMKYEFRLLS